MDTIDFKALKDVEADLKLIAYEDANHQSEHLYQVLQLHDTISSVLVVVGSEGGFSVEEVEQLEAAGYIRVSLGARILRAETAAISLINNIAFFYEMVGNQS